MYPKDSCKEKLTKTICYSLEEFEIKKNEALTIRRDGKWICGLCFFLGLVGVSGVESVDIVLKCISDVESVDIVLN